MLRRPRKSLVWLFFIMPLLLAAGAGAIGPSLSYVEDFRTTQYKDAGATSAVWSTATGELKLIPFTPTALGSYEDAGYAKGVAVAGDVACIASSDLGLLTLDIHAPASPVFFARLVTAGAATGVAIAGTTAYVADGANGLLVVDIAHPAAPVLRGRYQTLDSALAVAVDGRYAYVATYGAGLTIVDVSTPTAPALVSRLATRDRAVGVAVAGSCAFVADYRAGLTAVDVSDPAAPVLGHTVETATATTGVAVWGNLVGVTTGTGGLRLFDVTEPADPVQLGGRALPGSATAVAFSGEIAYVTTTSAFCAVKVANPVEPTLKWTLELGQPGRGAVLAGDVAYVAADRAGLVAVRIGETTEMPRNIGGRVGIDQTHAARAAALSGDVLCLVAEPYGLVTFSAADPTYLTLLGSATTPGDATDVAVAGDLACVADSLSGLRLYNIGTPAAPAALGGYDTPGQAVDVAIAGRVAYVADGTGGLRLVSLANPASPSLLGACSLPGTANAVALAGSIACVTDGSLRLVNVANPAAPTLVGSYTGLGGAANGVVLAGNIAWVTAGTLGLCAIDIHDPSAPALVGSYVPGSNFSFWLPALHGDRVLVLARYPSANPSVRIIDVSNPASPTPATTFDPWTSAVHSLMVDGDLMFLCHGLSGPGWLGGISVAQIAQGDVSGAHTGFGGSLNVVGGTPYIVRARLAVTATGDIDWKLNIGSGLTSWWPDGTWHSVQASGFGLEWGADLAWDRSNPVATRVQLDWRLQEARIDSIVDVRPDQGGWVNLYFTSSGYDLTGYSPMVAGYTVYRKVSDAALVARVTAEHDRLAKAADEGAPGQVELDGASYVVNTGLEKAVPSGVWSVVASLYATQSDRYVVTLPTTADDGPDGPAYTQFYVTAHTTTPAVFYASVADSGRSVDNIAPGVPAGFAAAYGAAGAALDWAAAPERDFQYYRVYRGTTPGFAPGPATLLQSTAATAWIDAVADPWHYSYKLTVVDHAGNESPAAAPATVTSIDDGAAPARFALRGNEPNPFNPVTTIHYDVPAGGGALRLAIYDARGRLVRTLADGVEPFGRRSILWNGRDDQDRAVPAGVYVCRLTAPGYARSVKMSLVQ